MNGTDMRLPTAVVTLLNVTISLSDRNDNSRSQVGRDNPSVSKKTKQKGRGSPRLEHLSVDATCSRSFPCWSCFTAILVLRRVDLRRVDHSLQGVPHRGQHRHRRETEKVTNPSGPDLQMPRQCRAVSRFHCRTAAVGHEEGNARMRL